MRDEVLDWLLEKENVSVVSASTSKTIDSFKKKFSQPKRDLKQQKDVRCTFTLDRQLHDFLTEKAKKEGRTISALIRIYLWEKLERENSTLNI